MLIFTPALYRHL